MENSKDMFRGQMSQLSEAVWEMTSRIVEHKQKHPKADISKQWNNLTTISQFEMLYWELCFQRDDAVNEKKHDDRTIKHLHKIIKEKDIEISKLLKIIENL